MRSANWLLSGMVRSVSPCHRQNSRMPIISSRDGSKAIAGCGAVLVCFDPA
jgi:hypothetical protein